MKKLMIATLALVATASIVSAQSVTSANVVGYKADVAAFAADYTMMGVPFTPIGTTATPIATLFADNSLFTAGYASDGSDADVILVWLGGGIYSTYFYSAYNDPTFEWESDQNPGTPTGDTVPAGGAFWFLRNSNGAVLTNLTVAGEVIKTNVTVSAAANDYTMMGNPFPAPLPIASIAVAEPKAGYASDGSDSDVILVWLGGGIYATYFYSAYNDPTFEWESDQNPGSVTADVIPAGGSFWFLRCGDPTSVTLPVPYSL